MYTFIYRVLHYAALPLSLVLVFCAIQSANGAEESFEYKLKKAKAALAIRSDGSKPIVIASVKATAPKRKVYEYHANFNCPPCKASDAFFKDFPKDQLPFERITKDLPNFEPDGYPFYRWKNVHGDWIGVSGWSGLPDLLWQLEAGDRLPPQKAKLKSQPKALPTTGYTWPKRQSLPDHLRSTHGVEVANLPQWVQVKIHDALHNGYSLAQIRAYASSHGYRF